MVVVGMSVQLTSSSTYRYVRRTGTSAPLVMGRAESCKTAMWTEKLRRLQGRDCVVSLPNVSNSFQRNAPVIAAISADADSDTACVCQQHFPFPLDLLVKYHVISISVVIEHRQWAWQ